MTKRHLLSQLLPALAIATAFGQVSTAAAAVFLRTDLVTDDQAANPAQITDTNLVNAWGVSRSATSPFWVSNNGTGTTTLYRTNPITNATSIVPLVVSIPGAGNVTGQVFSGTASQFNGDSFLFVSEDGTVAGWRGALGTTAETLQLASASNNYKGTTLAVVGGQNYLYSANFGTGQIDVLKGNAAAPNLTGSFTDPNLPAGYAPFNVQLLGSSLFVTYALKDASGDDVAGVGNGYVNQFDLQGNFLRRLVSNGPLNSPWGLAIAPTTFGELAGDLLVGNFGDGLIHAYDLVDGSLDGALVDPSGDPLAIDGLWALISGNGVTGSTGKIYFSAGPDGEAHGLFGVLEVPEPASILLLGLGVLGLARVSRRRA